MSNRTTLKGYFVTNAIPKQSDFADMIDSALVQTEDSIRKQGSDPVAIQAQQADQNGTQQVLHFFKNFNDANAAWKLGLVAQNPTNPASGLNIGSSTVQNALFIKESDGSIGIGTNNPLAKLHINGGNAVVEGNAGIGTTTPAARLDVNGMAWFRNNPGGGLGSAAGQGVKISTENSVGYIFSYDYASSKPLDLILQGKGGNVGINVAAPRSKLDIGILTKGQLGSVFGRLSEGDNNGSGTFLGVRGYVTQVDNDFPVDRKSFAIEHSFFGQVNSSINFFRGFAKTGGFITFNTNSNTEQIRIDPDGNVGIGITAPGAKLHVAGFKSGNIASYRWFAKSSIGPWGDTFNPSAPISILASDRVVASEFNATSDLRIKKDFVIDDARQSLEAINRVQIKNFRYKDEIQHGSAWNKGVIAQELETVFPEAVTKHTDFVPDIYSLPQSVSASNNILTVTMENPHHLVTGDTIRLITPTGSKDVKAVKTSDNAFVVDNWQEASTDIFVYGKQVNDYRTVNYNSIFCLGIGAIQELYKQLQQLKKEIETIKERMPVALVAAI